MKHLKIIVIIMVLLGCLPIEAQKKKTVKKAVKPAAPVVEKTPQEILYENMLPATAKVMFIDSIVVDKADFLSHLPLSKELGSVTVEGNRVSFTNEFDNRCFFSDGDTINGRFLYTSDKLGNDWSTPRMISEIGKSYKEPNYPFMMADGITMFFSAKGSGSIGGFDIFMTLYNSEDAIFYEPQNYGLPFNSTANEYFIAIDEIHKLGWLVSDRYQPEDKVCIYIFEPTSQRHSYEEDDITEAELRRKANLESIKETWGFGNRKEALKRLEQLEQENSKTVQSKGSLDFVINDKITYSSENDFRSPDSKKLFKQFVEMKGMLDTRETKLEQLRAQYANANLAKRQSLVPQITATESEVAQLRIDLKTVEKKIRNTEIEYISR